MTPLYRNVTSTRKTIGDKVVEPGKDIRSLVYYNENDAQLLKVSDMPSYNSTILCGKMIKPGVLAIPEKDALGNLVAKFAIHFAVLTGDVSVRFNAQENNPSLDLYEGCKWNIRLFERQIDKIYVDGKDFDLRIIIEKLG